MKKQIGDTLVAVLGIIVALFGVVGWVWNIVKIIHDFAMPITGMFIMRIIGVFMAPIGAVLGWF